MHLGCLFSSFRLVQEQQTDWKRHRWQKIRPKLLRKLLTQQEDLVKQLPEKASAWDVTMGIQQSIQRMLVSDQPSQLRISIFFSVKASILQKFWLIG